MSSPDYTTDFVKSTDGTNIGFRKLGQGPSLVLLHGAGQTGENLLTLARNLSESFTVYVPDRRGRGISGPYSEDHSVKQEIDDLDALLTRSGARCVFGLSAGAVIAIEAALVRPQILRLALYEPPISFDGVIHAEWVPRYEREQRAGNLGGALITVMRGTADRTSPLRYLPRTPLAAALNFIIKRTADRAAGSAGFSPRDLIATVHYDAQVVMSAAGDLKRFKALRCPVLLLGGTKSAHNLRATLEGLAAALPTARKVILRGAGHTAPDNGGKPALVAAELRAFFAE